MDSLLAFLAVLLFTFCFFSAVQSTEFTIVNECRSTIWPGIETYAPAPSLTPSGFILKSNESKILWAPNSWEGTIWGRTNCSTDTSTGNFSCLTGDCSSGKLECNGSRVSPATLVEFNLTGYRDYGLYGVSLLEGFNLPILVEPKTGGCSSASCLSDLNASCPPELRVERKIGSRSETVACMRACNSVNTWAPCCTSRWEGECFYSSSSEDACPHAYTYAGEKQAKTVGCSSPEYIIIFCPPANTSLASAASARAPPPPSPPPPPPPPPAPGPIVSVPTRPIRTKRSMSTTILGLILGAIVVMLLLLTLLGWFWCQRRNGCLQVIRRMSGVRSWKHREKGEDSFFFSYTTIEIATNYFSDESILGRGGYGPVYKGELLNGQEIAVKRLQKMSGHGTEQFKNEVTVISNLQHRNLVRLLGYCNENDERILVYEYLPNKSLDSILFADTEKRAILGWKLRLQIIEGIAQGLLYLHKYSRLKIIHRDLKTSNVLLDNDLNPKISDFGTAKIFGDDESYANTNRIVGTYGYMAPEYAMDGIFSMKSDVFSFGVMMLEIISGKKNTGFYNTDRHINLLGYVWDLWNEERFSEIADPNLVETISITEVVRYVQVGLLCVQENASDRPTMSTVVSILQHESMPLPTPKQPSFTAILSVTNPKICETLAPPSLNMVTISDVNGR